MADYPKRFDEMFQFKDNFNYPYEMTLQEQMAYQQYEFALNQYCDLVNYLNSTTDLTDEQGERKGYGHNESGFEKDMDDEITTLFRSKVSNLLTAGQNFLSEVNPDETSYTKKKSLFNVRKNIKQCLKENSVLENLNDGEHLSYKAMHARATDAIIDVGDDELNHVGGTLSSRFTIRYMDESGKLQKGFFTKDDTIVDREAIYYNARENAPNLEGLFNYLDTSRSFGPSNERKNYLDLPKITGNVKSKDMKNLATFKQFVSDCNKQAKITVCDVNSITQSDADTFAEMLSFFEGNKALVKESVNKVMHLSVGNTSNKRNTAMSSVATALGMPDIIAKTTPMTIIKNGETIHGCFMANAKGISIDDVLPDNAMFGNKGFSIDYDKVLTSATDLMVLDYICLNGDRHQDNMYYIFGNGADGKPVLEGFQGIDNDLSFGTIVPKNDERVKYLPPLNDISMMKKETADMILGLSETKLRAALVGSDLTKEEIDCCCERTKNLQSFIKSNKPKIVEGSFTERDWKTMRKVAKNRTVDCDPISNFICLENEYNDALIKYNYLDKGKQMEQQNKYFQQKKSDKIKEGLANLKNKIYIDEKATLKNQRATMKKLFSKLDKPGINDIPEYAAMYNTINELNKTIDSCMNNLSTSDNQRNLVTECFKQAQEAVEDYLINASTDVSRKAGKRNVVAQMLNEECINGINTREMQVNQLNTLMSNTYNEINSVSKKLDLVYKKLTPKSENNKKNQVSEKPDSVSPKNNLTPETIAKIKKSYDYVVVEMELNAKINLAQYVGNCEKLDAKNRKNAERSLAEILVSTKLQQMGVNDRNAYRARRSAYNEDNTFLTKVVDEVVASKEFKTMMKSANPINAVANKTTDEMLSLANEMGMFEKIKSFNTVPAPQTTAKHHRAKQNAGPQ